jgi:hypothetical protein
MLLDCLTCGARVDAEEVAELVAPIRDPEIQEAYEMSHQTEFEGEVPCPAPQWRYTLLQCPVCRDPLLAYSYDFDRSFAQRVWPPDRPRLVGVPLQIERAHHEAVRCRQTRSYVATVLMCRRALEGMCRHFYPTIRPLAFGLKKLQDEGIIDARLAEWAHALRDSGNLAAHDPDAGVTEADADDLLEFTEAILAYVFVLSERFRSFQRRRSPEGAG